MWIYRSGLSCGSFLSSDSGYSKKYLSELDGEYEKLKDSPIPELSLLSFKEYEKSGRRLSYEKPYFLRRAMLRDFALKAWLGDGEALVPLEKIIEAVCEEHTWALPAHAGGDIKTVIDLFAAETAQTLAEIVSLLADKLPAALLERVINEVKSRVLLPFINRKKKYNWERMNNNWCAVCGGAVGMAAVYLIEDTNALESALKGLTDVFKSYGKSFTADGACLEGLYYWDYGMTYLIAFLDLYRERTGKDFPVNTKKLAKMADFAHNCCMTGGATVSFSDSSEHDRICGGLSAKLTELYGAKPVQEEYRASLLYDDCGRWCKAARDIAWTREHEAKPDKVSVLNEAQWAVIRTENASLAIKGGHNGEPHNHNDIGSFIAVRNGDALLCDIGAGEYTREYFSDGRYNIFCNSSFGHSVPVINDCPQKTGEKYAAKNFHADFSGAAVDISGAYGIKELKKCLRKVEIKGNEFSVTDEFEVSKPVTVTERFITRHRAVGTLNGADIISDGKTVARIESGCVCEASVNTYSHHEHDGAVSEITAIDFAFIVNEKYTFNLTVK